MNFSAYLFLIVIKTIYQGLQKFCNFTFKLKKLGNYGVNFFLSPQDFQGLPKDWEKIEQDFSETIVLEKKIEIVV